MGVKSDKGIRKFGKTMKGKLLLLKVKNMFLHPEKGLHQKHLVLHVGVSRIAPRSLPMKKKPSEFRNYTTVNPIMNVTNSFKA
ncbi:unnamed protein product [Acanthoscelides obtectus]|uniref:Uncharacterized protein n=1 Tax=Acanthoscelides obtectus TaxID=200917 RepID=A0A9P0KHG8_ACAOB|nr:unnamed protein product [Acanthoscelides obtectus]CAK1672683.1 hypothetical protein AOBTE_LOCUS29041 [Acanthoscelides obtectus]